MVIDGSSYSPVRRARRYVNAPWHAALQGDDALGAPADAHFTLRRIYKLEFPSLTLINLLPMNHGAGPGTRVRARYESPEISSDTLNYSLHSSRYRVVGK